MAESEDASDADESTGGSSVRSHRKSEDSDESAGDDGGFGLEFEGEGPGEIPPIPPPEPLPPEPPPPEDEGDAEDEDEGGGAPAAVFRPPVGRDGNPWPYWVVEGYGYLVLDFERETVGAHCIGCDHGLCRANKTLKRLPLGYLVAWLIAGHERIPPIRSRAAHKGIQKQLCDPIGLPQRQLARDWLLARADAFRMLLDLEAAYRLPGEACERVKILH